MGMLMVVCWMQWGPRLGGGGTVLLELLSQSLHVSQCVAVLTQPLQATFEASLPRCIHMH